MKNIYIIKSDSYRLINDQITELAKEHNNIEYFSLIDNELDDIIESASTYGLFDEHKVIVVKDAKYFGGVHKYENELDILYKFLSNIDDITIIFINDNVSSTKEFTKKIVSIGASIIDASQTPENIKAYIYKYLKENEISMNENTINELITNTLNNLDIIIQEIDKLSLIDKNITSEMVKNSGVHEINDVTFDFSNAVVAKNFNVIFELLDTLLKSDVEILSLIGLLHSSYANMYMVKDAVANGLTDEEIATTLGYSNAKRVFVMKKNGQKYSLDDLKNIILNLADLDKKIKTGYNPVYEFKEFLLNL